MAFSGSLVVEHSTTNPEVEGSNPGENCERKRSIFGCRLVQINEHHQKSIETSDPFKTAIISRQIRSAGATTLRQTSIPRLTLGQK
jgi:hypothetical protein